MAIAMAIDKGPGQVHLHACHIRTAMVGRRDRRLVARKRKVLTILVWNLSAGSSKGTTEKTQMFGHRVFTEVGPDCALLQEHVWSDTRVSRNFGLHPAILDKKSNATAKFKWCREDLAVEHESQLGV
jgi:hypothetical protein